MQVSAIIITKNEERNIERCLQSLAGVVDEIVIVDSYSTDSTQDICTNYPVKFFQKEWMGYAEQKNYANSLSKNDLILSIDADEALSEELKTSLLALQSIEKQNFVCQVNRLTNYCGKWVYHCGWYPDKKIRIFNKHTAKWTGNVHETVYFPSEAEIIHLKGNLLHYSYYSISEHIAQANKYSTLAAKEYFEKNKKYSTFVLLCKSLWRFKRDYVFKGGFLDGYYGFIICTINAMTTFLKYIKLKQLYKIPT